MLIKSDETKERTDNAASRKVGSDFKDHEVRSRPYRVSQERWDEIFGKERKNGSNK